MKQGPNVKKLIAKKMSIEAIPDGGSVLDGVKFLLNKKKIEATAEMATLWTKHAIKAIRNAKEPNPWKESSDEDIAEEILKRIKDKEAGGRR